MMLHEIGQDQTVHQPDLNLSFDHVSKGFSCSLCEHIHVPGIQYDRIPGIPAALRTAGAVGTSNQYHITGRIIVPVKYFFYRPVTNHLVLPHRSIHTE